MDKKQRIGQSLKCSVGEEKYVAYIPQNLPPHPPLMMDELYLLLDKANTALGRLDGLSMILPDPSLFLYSYSRCQLSPNHHRCRRLLSLKILRMKSLGRPKALL